MIIFNKNNGIVLPCILMGGQSNMSGGDSSGSPDSSILNNQNAFIFFKPNDASSTDNGTAQTLQYGKNQNYATGNLVYNGPELSFAKQWSDNHSTPILIIKYAYSGSMLVDDGTVSSTGLWQIDANPANCNGLPHYSNFINNFCIPAIQKCQRRGFSVDIRAIAWGLGETDANDASRAPDHETELMRLFNQVNTDLDPYMAVARTILPIICRTHNNFSPARPYASTIRTAQQNVASAFGTTVIDTDSYGLIADTIHFSRAAQKTQGEDIYTRYNAI